MTTFLIVIAIFIAIPRLEMPFGGKFSCCKGGGDQIVERNGSHIESAWPPRGYELGEAIEKAVTDGGSRKEETVMDERKEVVRGPCQKKTFAAVLAENEQALKISKRKREKERLERLLAEKQFNLRSISWPSIQESLKQKANRTEVTDDLASADLRQVKSTSDMKQMIIHGNIPTSINEFKKSLRNNRTKGNNPRKPVFSKMSSLGPMPAIDVRPKIENSQSLSLFNKEIDDLVGLNPFESGEKTEKKSSGLLGKLENTNLTDVKKVNHTTILYKDDDGSVDTDKLKAFDEEFVDGMVATRSSVDSLKMKPLERPKAAKYPRTPFSDEYICDNQQSGTVVKEKKETKEGHLKRENLAYELFMVDEEWMVGKGTEYLKLDPSKCPATRKLKSRKRKMNKRCQQDKSHEQKMDVMPSLRGKVKSNKVEKNENKGEPMAPRPPAKNKDCSTFTHRGRRIRNDGGTPSVLEGNDPMRTTELERTTKELERTPINSPRCTVQEPTENEEKADSSQESQHLFSESARGELSGSYADILLERSEVETQRGEPKAPSENKEVPFFIHRGRRIKKGGRPHSVLGGRNDPMRTKRGLEKTCINRCTIRDPTENEEVVDSLQKFRKLFGESRLSTLRDLSGTYADVLLKDSEMEHQAGAFGSALKTYLESEQKSASCIEKVIGNVSSNSKHEALNMKVGLGSHFRRDDNSTTSTLNPLFDVIRDSSATADKASASKHHGFQSRLDNNGEKMGEMMEIEDEQPEVRDKFEKMIYERLREFEKNKTRSRVPEEEIDDKKSTTGVQRLLLNAYEEVNPMPSYNFSDHNNNSVLGNQLNSGDNAGYINQHATNHNMNSQYSSSSYATTNESRGRFHSKDKFDQTASVLANGMFDDQRYVDSPGVKVANGPYRSDFTDEWHDKEVAGTSHFMAEQEIVHNREQDCSFARTFKSAQEKAHQRLMGAENYSVKKKIRRVKKILDSYQSFQLMANHG